MSAPPAGTRLSLTELIRQRAGELSPDLSNWLTVGLAAGVAFPSRLPPRAGLFGRSLGRAPLTLKLRNGYRLRCRLDELEGYYAAFVHREYRDAVANWSDVETIVDVGANVGATTLWFARSSPRASIVAVEPSPEVFQRLIQNVRRSGLSHRVTPVAAALGATPGLATVLIRAWSVETTTAAGVTGGGPVVARVSLAQLLAALNLRWVDVLKLDCEGAEYESLLSAAPSVLQSIGTIVAELHLVPGHSASELEKHLQASGFLVRVDVKPGQAGILVATRPRS